MGLDLIKKYEELAQHAAWKIIKNTGLAVMITEIKELLDEFNKTEEDKKND